MVVFIPIYVFSLLIFQNLFSFPTSYGLRDLCRVLVLKIVLIQSLTIHISWSCTWNKTFLIYKMKTYFTVTLKVKVWNSITTEHLRNAHSNDKELIHEKRGGAKWNNSECLSSSNQSYCFWEKDWLSVLS